MKFPAAQIASIVVLCVAAAAVAAPEGAGLVDPAHTTSQAVAPVGTFPFEWLAEAWQGETANQVSIEQHITIRIAPRPSAYPDPRVAMFSEMPERAARVRVEERSMAKCLPIDGIAGVQVAPSNRLFLFLRDARVVSAALGKGCNAADYYSGFYVARSADGMMCAGRDKLQSRNGANCKLGKMKQLVQTGN